MGTSETLTGELTPLLFRYATPRTSGEAMPGLYDAQAQVWVVETERGLRPVVEVGDLAMLETRTLTKVAQEVEDEDVSSGDVHAGTHRRNMLAELATKTEVAQESDDQISASCLLELLTKTHAQLEKDDDRPIL